MDPTGVDRFSSIIHKYLLVMKNSKFSHNNLYKGKFMKKYILLITFFCTISNLIADDKFISTKEFVSISVEPDYFPDYDIPNKWYSPNRLFKAYTKKQSTLYILSSDNKLIYKVEWDDYKIQFPQSDTIYILGWSSDSKRLWFWSNTPTTCAYFAEVDLVNHVTTYYRTIPELEYFFHEFVFDANKGVCFFSDFNFQNEADDEKRIRDTVFTLFSFDVKSQQKRIIATKKGYAFYPEQMNSNTLIYSIDSNKLPSQEFHY